jgi:hypothetical protein
MDDYVASINKSLEQAATDKPYIALLSESLTPVTGNALCHLAAFK